MELRDRVKKLETARTPEEANRLISDMVDKGKETIQMMINEALKRGHDSKSYCN